MGSEHLFCSRLCDTSSTLKAVTFVRLRPAVGPAVSAHQQASDIAAQQSTWRALSDQVALVIPGAVDESGFQGIKGSIGDSVAQAEKQDQMALSDSWASARRQVWTAVQSSPLSLVSYWIVPQLDPADRVPGAGPAGLRHLGDLSPEEGYKSPSCEWRRKRARRSPPPRP